MNELIGAVLIGYVLGAVPSSETGRISVAALGKKLGIKPKEIEKYNDTENNNE
ncbi:hypothetical protein [Natrinema versiforme]|uniref:hypothetical protein n=1 Tax=Natrinema versiforme TaxID=88724 RepID=UPI00135F14E7|nr:hypothetical protein [Natrinema versiforme]